jgi:hypothetical protein
MFFTTIRVKEIDGAIASRIHFKIQYANLGPDQKRGVWKYLVDKAVTPQGSPVYSRSSLESLIGKDLNGREVRSSYYVYIGIGYLSQCLQIKNITSTAHAWYVI